VHLSGVGYSLDKDSVLIYKAKINYWGRRQGIATTMVKAVLSRLKGLHSTTPPCPSGRGRRMSDPVDMKLYKIGQPWLLGATY
jgi:predicted GNAT family acetyltransferase